MKQLTIFTPTYNRAYTLPRLYQSLQDQDIRIFKWLIVDDGSTDNTKQLVNRWIDEGKLEIRYIYQKNAGKMAAHNRAVLECDTELFLCCDSDDWMEADSVSKAIDYWNNNQNIISDKSEANVLGKIGISGMVSPRRMINRDFDSLGTLPEGIRTYTLTGLYKKGFKGETALFFRTSVIRQYPFPVIEGEKFVPESYVYRQIERKYDMLVYPHYCMDCEYQPDGYTVNSRIIRLKNPKGVVLDDIEQLGCEFTFKKALQVLGMLEYIGEPYCISKLPHYLSLTMLYPLGIIAGKLYKRMANKLINKS